MLFDKWLTFRARGKSASVCKDRLQIVIARERCQREESLELAQLRSEIVALICRFYDMSSNEDIDIFMEKQKEHDILALNIRIPARPCGQGAGLNQAGPSCCTGMTGGCSGSGE